MPEARLAVIGGTGIYDIEGLTDIKEVDVDTPFVRQRIGRVVEVQAAMDMAGDIFKMLGAGLRLAQLADAIPPKAVHRGLADNRHQPAVATNNVWVGSWSL